jgi:GxxExxY protein
MEAGRTVRLRPDPKKIPDLDRRRRHMSDEGPVSKKPELEGHEVMKGMKKIGREFSQLSHLVIGSAISVHRELGPGLLETTYRKCFTQELALRGVRFEVEVPLAIEYKGLLIDFAYRIDVFVERQIVVEIKSLEALKWIHEAQVLTYMKHSGARTAFLMNFNAPLLRDGLKSYAL